MDRFEEDTGISESLISNIYIPVWIDLKLFVQVGRLSHIAIYIPVWIDLKYLHQRYHQQPLMYLHSSMDRFEEQSTMDKTYALLDLHSSMDRFEDDLNDNYLMTVPDLHSSMDRFEVLADYFANLDLSIYIPVWIDLKYPIVFCL